MTRTMVAVLICVTFTAGCVVPALSQEEREGEAHKSPDDQKAPRKRRHQALAPVRLRSRFGGLGSREAGKRKQMRDPEILAAVASIEVSI